MRSITFVHQDAFICSTVRSTPVNVAGTWKWHEVVRKTYTALNVFGNITLFGIPIKTAYLAYL